MSQISLPSGRLSQQMAWDTLNAMEFNKFVYLPCLKLSITSGAFILYRSKTDNGNAILQVGRVVDVSSSIDKIPQSEDFPSIQEAFQEDSHTSNEMPIQFVKVNVFKDRSLLSDRDFRVDDNFLSTTSKWRQLEGRGPT